MNVYWHPVPANEITKDMMYGPSREIDGVLVFGGSILWSPSESGFPVWVGARTGIGLTLGGSYGIGDTQPGFNNHPVFNANTVDIKKKILIIIATIAVIVFLGIILHGAVYSICHYYDSSFSGEITQLRYTERKLLKIKINGNNNWHYLDVHIKYDVVDIELGDTIIKAPCSYTTYLVKDNKTYDISSERNINLVKKFCKCE